MDKKRLVLLVLCISFIMTGCSGIMTAEEFSQFEGKFYEIFDDVSQQVNARLILSVFMSVEGKKVDVSHEVNSGLSFLEKLLNQNRSKIPQESLEGYEELAKVVSNMRKIENEITTTNNVESLSECSSEFLEFYKARMENINIDPFDVALKTVQESESFVNTLEFKISQYKENNNINLDWTDVQYDMQNNLDKEFVVAGVAELDDYYNYGFRDYEKDYFCACLTPPNGKFSDRWYLYFHRNSFRELFDELKKRDVQIITTCKIPKYIFKQGQGNMAEVERVQW